MYLSQYLVFLHGYNIINAFNILFGKAGEDDAVELADVVAE